MSEDEEGDKPIRLGDLDQTTQATIRSILEKPEMQRALKAAGVKVDDDTSLVMLLQSLASLVKDVMTPEERIKWDKPS